MTIYDSRRTSKADLLTGSDISDILNPDTGLLSTFDELLTTGAGGYPAESSATGSTQYDSNATLADIVAANQQKPFETIAGVIGRTQPVLNAPTGKVALAQYLGQLGPAAMSGVASMMSENRTNSRDAQIKDYLTNKQAQQAQALAGLKAQADEKAKLRDMIYNADPKQKQAYFEARNRGDVNASDLLSKGTAGVSYGSTPEGLRQKGTDRARSDLIKQGYDPKNVEKAIQAAQGTSNYYDASLIGSPRIKGTTSKDYTNVKVIEGTNQVKVTNPQGKVTIMSRSEYDAMNQGQQPQVDQQPTFKTMADLTPEVSTGLKLNASESQNLGWYTSAVNAEKGMREAMEEGFDPTTPANSALLSLASSVNKDGSPTIKSAAAYQALSPAGQKYTSAANQYIETKGRKASGGAIPNSEQLNFARQDLPRYGDDANALEQKQLSRMSTVKGMATSTGKASEYTLGDYETRFGQNVGNNPSDEKQNENKEPEKPTKETW